MKPRLLASAYKRFTTELSEAEERVAQLRAQMGPTHEDGGGWHDNSAFDQLKTDERNAASAATDLRNFLAHCEVVEPRARYTTVDVGCRVTIKELEPGRFDISGEYLIIGDRRPPFVDEEESTLTRISTDSPVGQLLMGASSGGELSGKIGDRTVRFLVVSLN
jgi:transcription elongation GreA/GreB family factor